MESYEELTPIQRKAHLLFWYDSEVNNGGHAQYFDNCGNDRVPETIEALRGIGGNQFAEILRQVFEAHMHLGGRVENWNEEVSRLATNLDRKFYSARPNVTDLLERLLNENEREFIEIIDED